MIRSWRLVFQGVALVLLLIFACASPALGDSNLDLLSTGPSPSGSPSDAAYVGSSQDGTHVFFQTRQQLASSDTDSSLDVYDRSGGATTLVSTGVGAGNGPYDAYFAGASSDGLHVFFETKEALLTADRDSSIDVYDRSGGATRQISTAAVGANGPYDAHFAGASTDGTKVFFRTDEPITGDSDTFQDIYQRTSNTTSLVSVGPASGTPADAFFEGASADGSRVFFSTSETLVGADTDNSRDIYERSGGNTTLLSTGPNGGNSGIDAFFEGNSQDGTHVFFQTREGLTSDDTDTAADVYDHSGGSTTLVSAGGTAELDAYYLGSSQDGTHVFFQTLEPLTSGDTDTFNDIYDRSGGNTTLVSTGPSGGNGDADAYFQGISSDGSIVFFDTAESLVPEDTDTMIDLYEHANGATTLVSTGPAGGNGSFDADFAAASQDGSRVLFTTQEQLVDTDTDTGRDLYLRARGTTTLVSAAQGVGNSGADAFYRGESLDGALVFFDTDEALIASDTDTTQDVYVATDRQYSFPVGASPMRIPLVPAFQACAPGSSNASHKAPLASASCNPPLPTSSLVAIGPRSQSFARFRVLASGQCAPFNPSACAPDFVLTVNATDIRAGSPTGADYDTSDPGSADLIFTATLPGSAAGTGLQLTDHYNRPQSDPTAAFNKSATGVTLRFPVPVNCTPTADASVGSTCSVQTTANTLAPGAAISGSRALWETGRPELYDQGLDGVPGNADDSLFAAQGVYVP